MMVALFMDKTFYILNLLVQSLGYYLQNIIVLGWHTDAFEQLGPSAHGEIGRFVATEDVGEAFANKEPDGPEDWMDTWTMFYWGWWISWSPFVGMCYFFVLKVILITQSNNSKGYLKTTTQSDDSKRQLKSDNSK